MKKTPEKSTRAAGDSVRRLVLLAKELKRITGEDPNVTIKTARAMAPAELEEQLRAFGIWYRAHAEENAQRVEQAIWAALDDEENAKVEAAPPELP